MASRSFARIAKGFGVALAIGAMVATTPALAQDLCKTTRSATAVAVRTLQSDLMVAALSCQVKSQYNVFATQFKDPLVQNGKVLKAEFDRRFGGQATKRLTTYVTELANQASQRMSTKGSNYCAEVSALFATVLALPPAELGAFARGHVAAYHGGDDCTVERIAMATLN